jgi:hypothetical protein
MKEQTSTIFWRFGLQTALILIVVFILSNAGTYLFKDEIVETTWADEMYSTDISEPPHSFELFIKPKDFEKLEEQREKALETSVLIKDDDSEVDAKLIVDGEYKYDVSVRLKGDLDDHFDDEFWSYRVELDKNEGTIFGIREFSLQKVESRGEGEIVLLEHMRDAGILAPRLYYADLTVNDLEYGIVIFEEHFNVEVIEAQERRAGLIFKLDEDCVWSHHDAITRAGIETVFTENYNWLDAPCSLPEFENHPPFFKYEGHPYFMLFKVFGQGDVLEDPALQQQWEQAMGKLKAYKRGLLKSEEVFDMELMAKYVSILNMYHGGHGMYYTNIRFYYNPLTRLFEPVAFDNDTMNRAITFPDLYLAHGSDEFWENYLQEIDDLIQGLEDETLSEKIRGWENAINEAMEGFDFYQNPLEKANMLEYLKILKEDLLQAEKAEPYFPDYMQARELIEDPVLVEFMTAEYMVSEEEGAYIEFRNYIDRPTYVRSVYVMNDDDDRELVSSDEIMIEDNLRYEQLFHLLVPEIDVLEEAYEYEARFEGQDEWSVFEVDISAPPETEFLLTQVEIEDVLAQHDFLEIKEKNVLRVKVGDFEVKDNVILPIGYSLEVPAGVKLSFHPFTRLVLREGTLTILGEEENRVEFVNQSHANPWLGVAVLDAKGQSIVQYLDVTGVDYTDLDDWRLTGAVTFYESPVTLTNVHFYDNQIEDSLNIFRSEFEVVDCVFEDTLSDSIDVDFGKGEIRSSTFTNIGGDAIDVSGSEIYVTDVSIIGVGDKGISVGEMSDLKADNVYMEDVNTVIASKDGSVATLSDSKVDEVRWVALMSFIKKDAYPPASLFVENVDINNYEELLFVDEFSSINNSDIVPN